MSDVRFSNGGILPHTTLEFAKQLPAVAARVVVEDLRTKEYDDTVVIPERTQSKDELPGLRLARTFRTDEKKVLIREVGVDERGGGDILDTQ
jgi:hypothetical protein